MSKIYVYNPPDNAYQYPMKIIPARFFLYILTHSVIIYLSFMQIPMTFFCNVVLPQTLAMVTYLIVFDAAVDLSSECSSSW